jgi:hypothetical protein
VGKRWTWVAWSMLAIYDPPPGSTDDEVERANRWNGYDLDCSDFTITDFSITGSDPNRLDREGDGVGCES